jgi:hypothetical protein
MRRFKKIERLDNGQRLGPHVRHAFQALAIVGEFSRRRLRTVRSWWIITQPESTASSAPESCAVASSRADVNPRGPAGSLRPRDFIAALGGAVPSWPSVQL